MKRLKITWSAKTIAVVAVSVSAAMTSVIAISLNQSTTMEKSAKVADNVITTTTQKKKPRTTTTTINAAAAGLHIGSKGKEVSQLQKRLQELHYDIPAVTGNFDWPTHHAVMAFQKVNGLPRTGRATKDVLSALNTAKTPGALVPGGGSHRVEVDVPRQVLFYYKNNALNRIVSVSTGSGATYCVEGICQRALTPSGSFRVNRRISGLHTSKLGSLWSPLFFNRGIAIHGALSVPGYPASHGCVRVPMNSSPWLFREIGFGVPVYVIGGAGHVPPPFAQNPELKPGEKPPADDDATTSTTKKTTTTTLATTTTTEATSSTDTTDTTES